jgi:hypothetical protein
MPMDRYNVFDVITPSDTVDLARGLTDGVWVGGAGNLVAVMENGQARTLTGVTAGALLPLAVKRINATNTTATVILALYAR